MCTPDEATSARDRAERPTVTAKKRAGKKPTNHLTKARLAEMIEEATVDAYDESEQAMGWFTMFEEHLELPFETDVLGVAVRVTRIDHRDDDRLVAICARGGDEQAIGLAEMGPLARRDWRRRRGGRPPPP